MQETLHVKTSYMGSAHENIEDLAYDFLEFTDGVEFDTIVGVGLSGALVVPLLGHLVGLNWALVRKAGDGSHSSSLLEGRIGRRWMFVDDLISSGSSLQKTRERVLQASHRGQWSTAYVGSYFYTYGHLGDEIHPFRQVGEESKYHTGEYYLW